MRRMAGALLTLSCVGTGVGGATVYIGTNATQATLRVDANGTAEVSFVSSGKRDTVIVPPRGQLTHGGSLPGNDVSRKVRLPKLPLAVVVKRTPDGRYWALQQMQLRPGGPLDLHLARWRGEPTKIELEVSGERLEGRATFNGRGVSGFSSTLEGKRLRVYVYLDYFAGGKWRRMLGVAPKPDGSFSAFLRPAWQQASRYRATMLGPNVGTSFAPDAETVISAG